MLRKQVSSVLALIICLSMVLVACDAGVPTSTPVAPTNTAGATTPAPSTQPTGPTPSPSLGEVASTTLSGHSDWVTSVAFSPDGQTLASGSKDDTIKLWRVSDGTEIPTTYKGHTFHVTSVAYSPDGQTLASGSVDGTIKLWKEK